MCHRGVAIGMANQRSQYTTTTQDEKWEIVTSHELLSMETGLSRAVPDITKKMQEVR